MHEFLLFLFLGLNFSSLFCKLLTILDFTHICREFIDVAIYALYPESFCVKNPAVRKVFVFSDSASPPPQLLLVLHRKKFKNYFSKKNNQVGVQKIVANKIQQFVFLQWSHSVGKLVRGRVYYALTFRPEAWTESVLIFVIKLFL